MLKVLFFIYLIMSIGTLITVIFSNFSDANYLKLRDIITTLVFSFLWLPVGMCMAMILTIEYLFKILPFKD